MTLRTSIFILAIAASAAWAQDSPMGTINDMRRQIKGIGNATEQRRENATRGLGLSAANSQKTNFVHPSQATTKPPATTKAVRPVKVNPHVKAPVPMKDSANAKKQGVENKDVGSVTTEKEVTAENDENSGQESMITMRGRRDPFQTIIRTQPTSVGCSNGKKCLVVDKTDLKGIVRSQNGMIAIVENQQRKTYFLHENDPVFNGHVVKINPDSVVFRETVTDRVGRQSTREIIKRLSRPAV